MSSLYYFRDDWSGPEGPVDVLVVYIASDRMDGQQLLDVVTSNVQSYLRPDELIIIVSNSSMGTATAALSEPTIQPLLLERVGAQCAVTLWGIDGLGHRAATFCMQAGARNSGAALSQILRRGGTEIFNRHQGFVEGSETYHFKNPSNKHTDRFIRLSNILERHAEVSFLAMSLLPYLRPEWTHAWIDTPALYSVVSAASEIRRLNGLPDIRADNFRSYAGLQRKDLTPRPDSFALISASTSGGLAAELMEKFHFESGDIIHMLFLGENPPTQVAIDLAECAKSNPHGHGTERRTYEKDCPLCANGSLLIELKGAQFDISPPQPKALKVKSDHAPKAMAATMERLAGTRTFAVGRNGQHAVSAISLLAAPEFRKRLEFLVKRHVPGKLSFCIAADRESENFAAEVCQMAGSNAPLIQGRKHGEIQRRIVNDSGPILVVANVIGNGRILLDVSRELRTAAPDAPIIYLVGFAKPQSEESLKTLRSNLSFSKHHAKHGLVIVDQLVLPTAMREDSWKKELDFLKRTQSEWPKRQGAFLAGRIAILEGVALVDNLFVANSAAPLKLRPGFAFWPETAVNERATQADVFTTIANVLQSLRSAPVSAHEDALRTGWFRQTLIDPEVFGRFNDGIIQASFLRASLPSEMDYRSDGDLSLAAARLIGRVVEGADLVRGEGASEFLIAMATQRLRLCADHYEVALTRRESAPIRVATLRKLVRQMQS